MSEMTPEPSEQESIQPAPVPIELEPAEDQTLTRLPAGARPPGPSGGPSPLPPWQATAGRWAQRGQTVTREWARVGRESGRRWMTLGQKTTIKWIYQQGTWIFCVLIVASLIFLQDIISYSFIDRALAVAGFAIAIALPLNVTGLWIVFYGRNLDRTQATGKSPTATLPGSLPSGPLTADAFLLKRQRADTAVTAVLALSLLFTIIGLGSALWHISWVATFLFLLAIAASLVIVARLLR